MLTCRPNPDVIVMILDERKIRRFKCNMFSIDVSVNGLNAVAVH